MTTMRAQCLVALFLIFLVPFPSHGSREPRTWNYGINGGLKCSACTIVVAVAGQLAELKGSSLIEESRTLCQLLPENLAYMCNHVFSMLASLYGGLYQTFTDEITPDVICYGIKLCKVDPGKKSCHLFPRPRRVPRKPHFKYFTNDIADTDGLPRGLLDGFIGTVTDGVINGFQKGFPHILSGLCGDIPVLGIQLLCSFLNYISTSPNKRPFIDHDGDKFSNWERTARGSNWRGRDCNDWNRKIYPGRRDRRADKYSDTNCNGIWGVNPATRIPYESAMCTPKRLGTRGLIFLGDSVGANFHFPEVWVNATLLFKHPETLPYLIPTILDELDWPELGFATGHDDNNTPLLVQGTTDSLYLRLRQRNLCNHRDYQNLCRNGATSADMVDFVDDISRKATDKPALVFISVVGNDVCNRFPDTLKHMTTPEDFRSNITLTLDKLSHVLPYGSHVVLLGLADASFLFPTLSERIHPIGALHQNVKYKDVYKWLECMETSPCLGWLNANAELRSATTKVANKLSRVLRNLAATAKYHNFKVHFIPRPLSTAIDNYEAEGHELWEIIGTVDGFHPNQKAQPYIAEAIWSHLKYAAPDSLGDYNQKNDWIRQVFGDQGGH